MGSKSIFVLAMVVLFVVSPPGLESCFGGEVAAWGKNFYGQCDVPVGIDFIKISAGREHSLGLGSDGRLVAWGWNLYGQCDVPEGNIFVDIAGGGYHNLSLKSDGSLVGWGYNSYGQSNVPAGNDFDKIAAGYWHSLALKSDGSLVAWGSNGSGECEVPGGNDFIEIAAKGAFSIALKSNGSLVAWGHNTSGQCDVPEGQDFVDIAAGAGHGLALKSDGSLVAWGNTSNGRLDVPPGNEYIAISGGNDHSVALKSDGSLVAWGRSLYGNLNVPSGNDFIAISGGGYHNLALVAEPSTPPIADADGPYSIYVGDVLTLDASGSTDDDNDIVSYMWDLNDDGSFETDAGSQAIFDVNYADLQSLGLLINHPYTIHLKVTDNEDQSDIADSTLIIVPKPATVVAVDIKPGSCPNPVNVKSSGVLPVAILGTDDYDVTTIDIASIRLAGVEPLRSGYEDVAGPVPDSNDCNCITEGPDGFLDLTLKFATQRIVEAVGDVNDGDVRVLTLTGVLFDPMPFETPIEGADCILIRGRHKPINPADINKDGVVDMADFAIFAQNWLQSSIVDE